MKQVLKRIPILGPIAAGLYRKWIRKPEPFQGSKDYWINRYEAGGNSGDGSYNRLAEFKAEILNSIVLENGISTVIEYGCGDGNQLGLAQYPSYIGFDVSPNAVSRCRTRFANDATRTFKLVGAYDGETAEMTLSLDVIFHLVEDVVFVEYMNRLFDSSEKLVVIYSSNTDDNPPDIGDHVRHRHFSKWIADNRKQWNLVKHVPNRWPSKRGSKNESFADFFIYAKDGHTMPTKGAAQR